MSKDDAQALLAIPVILVVGVLIALAGSAGGALAAITAAADVPLGAFAVIGGALWLAGIAVIAFPALSGWQLATLISPVFVYVLLTRISGLPMIERRADRKWGDDPDYQAYKARTPVLWSVPGRGAS